MASVGRTTYVLGYPWRVPRWNIVTKVLVEMMLLSAPLLACRLNVQADPPEPEARKPSEVEPQVGESLTNGGVCFSVWKLLAKAGHGEGHKCLRKVRLAYRALTSMVLAVVTLWI